MAIRDSQYKLMHTFENNRMTGWYKFETPQTDDADIGSSFSCPPYFGILSSIVF